MECSETRPDSKNSRVLSLDTAPLPFLSLSLPVSDFRSTSDARRSTVCSELDIGVAVGGKTSSGELLIVARTRNEIRRGPSENPADPSLDQPDNLCRAVSEPEPRPPRRTDRARESCKSRRLVANWPDGPRRCQSDGETMRREASGLPAELFRSC